MKWSRLRADTPLVTATSDSGSWGELPPRRIILQPVSGTNSRLIMEVRLMAWDEEREYNEFVRETIRARLGQDWTEPYDGRVRITREIEEALTERVRSRRR